MAIVVESNLRHFSPIRVSITRFIQFTNASLVDRDAVAA